MCDVTDLNVFKRMTHHGNKHVDENDDDCDVIERKQKHSDALDDGRGVSSAGETICVEIVFVFRGELDLDAVNADEPEHRPEQTVQCTR